MQCKKIMCAFVYKIITNDEIYYKVGQL